MKSFFLFEAKKKIEKIPIEAPIKSRERELATVHLTDIVWWAPPPTRIKEERETAKKDIGLIKQF